MHDPDITNQVAASLVMHEAPYHAAAVFQIRDIFGRHVRTQKGSKPIVESNLLVRFDSAGSSARIVPDIFVAFGVDQPPASFRVPRDRNLRMLVLEVLSPGTYETDQSTKMLSYAEMGAAEYWLFDPTGKFQVPRLQGFRLADGKYVRILGSGESRERAVQSEVLSADLYLEDQAVRLAPATGQDVPTMSALEEFWNESKMRQRESGEDDPA